jgi:thymidine phosphorylase
MSQPLGAAAGNALEVLEAVEVLKGAGPPEVRDLTLELAAMMLALSGAAPDVDQARVTARDKLDAGAAWTTFLALVEAQGGDPRSVERDGGLPRAPVVTPVPAGRSGTLATVDTFGLGELVVTIGGGRRAKEDRIDPRVGLVVHARVGAAVRAGDVLAELHLAGADDAALERAGQCFTIVDGGVPAPALVLERID